MILLLLLFLFFILSFIYCCTRNTSIAQFKYARKYLADANGKSRGTPILSRKYTKKNKERLRDRDREVRISTNHPRHHCIVCHSDAFFITYLMM